jgi:hypothetical protein
MTVTVPNEQALRDGVAHAELDLNAWDQRNWIHLEGDYPQDACGTTACLAGHILLSQGMSLEEVDALRRESGGVPKRALEILGFKVKSVYPWNWDEFADRNTDKFYKSVFMWINDHRLPYDKKAGSRPLRGTPEAFKYFKEQIASVTGIEL